MGNRAVITTMKEWKTDGIGVYLHWNGGRDSVEAFVEYCRLKGYRAPDSDCYGWARLCQVIGNFFGGTTSVGIDRLRFLDRDNGDNGVYLLDGWDIVDRLYFEGNEQQEYDRKEMLKEIDRRMPEEERIGADFFNNDPVPAASLKEGDKVYVCDYTGEYTVETVQGIGEGIVNGTDVTGVPYVCKWSISDPARNINNYLMNETYVPCYK